MSKIARVFHLNKEIQKIYKNGVLQKLFFDWKKYIGEKLNIEKAKGHPSNRISINGKVYQNLFIYPLEQGHVDTALKDMKNKRVNSQVFNLTTKNFTIFAQGFEVLVYKNYNINGTYINWSTKINWTNTSDTNDIRIMIRKSDDSDITVDEVAGKIFLVEGDLSSETITEDSIEYLEEGTSELRNIIIEGKTYQNLVTNLDELTGKVCTTSDYASVSLDLFKTDTIYTLVSTISESNYSYDKFGAIIVIKYVTLDDVYIPISKVDGTFKNKFKISTEIPTSIRVLPHSGNSASSSFKLDNLIILEGDYTTKELPDKINGIESVSERENINLLKDIKWYDGFINMTTGKLEDKNSSYPDAKYTDIITVDPKILYITNLPQNSSRSRIRIYLEDGTFKYTINTFDELYTKYSTGEENIFKIRILMLYGSTIPENPYLIKDGENPDKTAYYINERVYNYECESDGIVLPNGVKNTIEEVNGVMNYVQRVGKITIDGSQKMTLSNVSQTQTTRIYLPLDNAKTSKGMNNLLCNWYIRNGDHGDYEYIIIQYPAEAIGVALFISILNSKLETTNLNGIIKYFKENPLSVYYELINPIYTHLYDSKEMIDTHILPNGLQDELTLRDSGFKRIQKTNTITLNGSEGWGLRVSNDDFSVYNCAGLSMLKTSTDYFNSSSKMICEQFAPSNISSMDSTTITKEGICLRQSGTGFILSISNSKLETQDLAGFKSYLQSNPVTVTYELDTQNIVDTNLTYPFENDTFDITLPLGQKDTIEGGFVIKRVWKLTVDNTTTFNFPTSLVKDNTVLISIPVTSITKLYDATVSAICDTLEFKNIYDLDETGFFINKAGNILYIRLPISDYGSTLTEVTEKLKTNKIVIYYPLLNEIKIPYINKININQPLRSLPNGVCDTIENGKLIQRVGKIVLDATNADNFKQVNTMQVFRWDYFFDTTSFVSGRCDKFPIKNVGVLADENKGVRLSGNNFKCLDIKFPDDTGLDINSFKTWLSENPITVYYELANAVETELNLPTISVKEGTNFITTTNNIKPNMQAESLVRCNETNMLNVKEFVGDANVIIDKIKVEKGVTYLFTFTNNLGENDVKNTPNIIASDQNISIISNTHNTLYGATVGANLGAVYTYKSGYQFTSNYDYVYITSCNANTTSKNLSDMCLKRV